MYTTNGSYTSYGLRPGTSYMGRLTWNDGTWHSIDIWVTTSTGSSASFTASNITASSVTWNAIFPVSGQWGSRVETYNSTDGWRDVSGTMYTTNGSYTSYSLRPGTSYMGRLTWYDGTWHSIDIWITTTANTASFTASNITTSSITWNAIFPVSGQWGSRVETWNSTDGWKDVSGTMYTTNGSYTSSGLRAGNSYMGRLTWYNYSTSTWNSIDKWVTTASDSSYQNINLQIAEGSGSFELIEGDRARRYTNGNIFVQLDSNNINNMTNGVDYFYENNKLWVSTSYLSSRMQVTSNAYNIYLNIIDSNTLAYSGSNSETVTYASYGDLSVQTTYYYTIVFLGGINTTQNYFDDAVTYAKSKYTNAKVVVYYPYNVMDGIPNNGFTDSIKYWGIVALQAKWVFSDSKSSVTNPTSRTNAVVSTIRNNYAPGSKLIIIGHSGGGVAALRAADILNYNQSSYNIPLGNVFQVGSPKVRIKDNQVVAKTFYLKATAWDPITYSILDSWHDTTHPTDLEVELNPIRTGLNLHASYFFAGSWSNGTKDNLKDTINIIYNNTR